MPEAQLQAQAGPGPGGVVSRAGKPLALTATHWQASNFHERRTELSDQNFPANCCIWHFQVGRCYIIVYNMLYQTLAWNIVTVPCAIQQIFYMALYIP